MLESGFIIAMGLSMWFAKMSWGGRITMLSYPLILDISVFVMVTITHWGTYTGVMSAAVASLMVSLLITCGRKVWGYKVNGKYVRGMIDVSHKLQGA